MHPIFIVRTIYFPKINAFFVYYLVWEKTWLNGYLMSIIANDRYEMAKIVIRIYKVEFNGRSGFINEFWYKK